MKKVLCLALVGSLMCAVGANAQTTVTLELKSDVSSQYYVEATITGGDPSEGLALFGFDVEMTSGGPPAQMANPGGDLAQFEVLLGLNNPAGYGGTYDGASTLMQVGGASNTINNDAGNAPYPIGTPPLGVGSTTITVAEGTCVDGVDEMSLRNCFANVIIQDEVGPVYAVSAATVTCTGTDVPCFGAPEPTLVAAWSVADHGDATDAWVELAFEIDLTNGLIEPRVIDRLGEMLFLRLEFDVDVDAADVSVTGISNLGTPVQGASNVVVEIPFTADPGRGSYMLDVNYAAKGVVGSFPYCPSVGDVNCDGGVTTTDKGIVDSPLNFGKNVTTAANPRADCSRDNNITTTDKGIIDSPLNFGIPVGTITCTCP